MGHSFIKRRWNDVQSKASRFRDEEDGTMTVLSISIFVIVMMVAGIGIDAMMAEMRRTQLQDTLDRAVLAAASLDQPLPAEDVVQEYLNNPRIAGTVKDITVHEGLGHKSVLVTAETTFDTKFLHWNWSTRMPTHTVDTVADGNAPSGGYGDHVSVAPIVDDEGEPTGYSTVITDYTNNESQRYTTDALRELTMRATSKAEESVGGVEISMVLDVSGSMNSNSRLTNLKIAAKDFVDTLTTTSEPGKLSISIVPYATQVSVPESLGQHLNFSNEHNYSRCANFAADEFSETEITATTPLKRTMHFDPWGTSDGRDDDPMTLVPSPVCVQSADTTREIVPLQNDATMLKNFIDNMWAGGNTSLDIGMKWGTALLDPAINPVVGDMVSDGDIPTDFAARPHAYDDGETLKIIVLMTDGQNTSQYYVDDEFRTGDSNIWWNEQEEVYSVYIGEDTGDEDNDGNTTEPMFYWPHTHQWKDHAYGEGVYEETQTSYECRSFRNNGSCKRYRKVSKTVTVDEPGSAEIVTYADLWARTSIKYNRNEHYYPWMNDSEANDDWYYAVRKYVGGSTKDVRTAAICDAAKAENIVVYTIGFEAPSGGQAVLSDCASSISHYYDVNGLEISDAFASIASSIRQLRLIQ